MINNILSCLALFFIAVYSYVIFTGVGAALILAAITKRGDEERDVAPWAWLVGLVMYTIMVFAYFC